MKKLSDYTASIPGASGVLSVLKDIVNSLPIKDIAEEYTFFFRKVLASVPSDMRDIAISLGLFGGKSESSSQALKVFRKLAGITGSTTAVSLSVKRKLLAKLKADATLNSTARVANLTIFNFDPNLFVAEINTAYGGRVSSVDSTTTLKDVFMPHFDDEFYQRLFNITQKRMGANYTAFAGITTFNSTSLLQFGRGASSTPCHYVVS